MLTNYSLHKCYIIAEIGGNFVDFDEAARLIDAAKGCGVDAVKLQTYSADTIASTKAIFNMENTGVVSQHALFKQYEIGASLHRDVFRYCSQVDIDCFSTPSHESDVELLDTLGVEAYKIGSDDAVNIPFLKFLAKRGKPIILSTGMCTMQEVRESVAAILEEGNEHIILLHAVTSYPTHPEHVNLLAMQSLKKEFPEFEVGYSDHTVGPTACICAAAMGARVVEKHFTYDKHAEGPDHMLSAEPAEMTEIVRTIRTFEMMKGTGVKRPAESEGITRINNRKSIVVNAALKRGDVITRDHLAIKRPGYGIQPKYFELIINRTARKDLDKDDILSWEDI